MPAWSDFVIKDYARYLGFLIGPDSSVSCNFRVLGDKLLSRVSQIAATPFSSTAAVTAISREAVPTIGYVAQLVELPSAISNLQNVLNSNCLKTPFRVLGSAAVRPKTDLNISAPVSLKDLSITIRVHTANKTLNDWQSWCDLLRTSFDANACFSSLARRPPTLSPPHWNIKPFAPVFYDAFPKDPFHGQFSESVFAAFSHIIVRHMFDAIIAVKGSLQSHIYRFCDNPQNSVTNCIRRLSCKHL